MVRTKVLLLSGATILSIPFVIALPGIIVRYLSSLNNSYRYYVSCLVNHFWPAYPSTRIRSYFRKFNFDGKKAANSKSGAPHANSAFLRDNAAEKITEFINSSIYGWAISNLGVRDPVYHEEYSYSMSKAQLATGVCGYRAMYGPKDFQYKNQRHDHNENVDVLSFVDVDYYINFEQVATKMLPMVLFTFNPAEVAGKLLDGTYTIIDDQVCTNVPGCTEYRHPLWDHNHDMICFNRGWYNYTYLVDHRPIKGTSYSFVLYTPVRRIHCLAVQFFFGAIGKPMARRKFKIGDFNVANFIRDKENLINIGKPGSHTSCSIPIVLYDRMSYCYASNKKAMSVGGIETMFRSFKSQFEGSMQSDATVYSAHWHAFLQQQVKIPKAYAICYDSAQVTLIVDGVPNDDDKPMGGTVHSPIIDGAIYPDRGDSATILSIEQRVLIPQAKPSEPLPPSYVKYQDEFIQLTYQGNVLHPISREEVDALQSRPNQVAQREDADFLTSVEGPEAKCFVKTEAMNKIGAPRNITSFGPEHRARFSRYTYALAAATKLQPWYAFGHNSTEFADRVEEICKDKEYIFETDFTLFDGNFSVELQLFTKRLLQKTFKVREDNHEVTRLWQNELKAIISSSVGSYDSGVSRLSGSPITSVGNSICSALIAYTTLREIGYDKFSAYDNLGAYGGDDGITWMPDTKQQVYAQVASRYGCVTKLVKCKQEVNFLGRIFIDPFATNASICDLRRQCPRLGISHGGTPQEMATNMCYKAEGFLVTDGNTPIVSEWATNVTNSLKPTHREAVYVSPFPQLPIDDPNVEVVARRLLVGAFGHDFYDSAMQMVRDFEFDTIPNNIRITWTCIRDGMLVDPNTQPLTNINTNLADFLFKPRKYGYENCTAQGESKIQEIFDEPKTV